MSEETTNQQTGRLFLKVTDVARRLMWVIPAAFSAWCLTPGLAAEPCPGNHQCYKLPHGRLSIPNAYTRPLMPEGENLGNFDPSKAWFSFWMPDGGPAGDVKASSFYMYPDAFEPPVRNQPPTPKNPPAPDPRTMVSVSFCLPKGVKEGGCFSPDQSMVNMVRQRNYEVEHHEPRMVVIDPARPAALLSGTSATIENVDDIFRFGSVHEYFGRAACNGQSCGSHFNFRCDVKVPYPPYQICDGFYEIKQLGFIAYVKFIGISEPQTLAMAEMTTKLVESWTMSISSGD